MASCEQEKKDLPISMPEREKKMKVIMISAYCVYMVAGLSAAAAMAGSI